MMGLVNAALPRWMWVAAGGGALVGGLALGGWWLHHAGYHQGRADEKQAALAAQQAAQEAMQQEKDHADAKYRGALLARQAVEKKLEDVQGRNTASAARIAGLLQQLHDRSEDTDAGGRSHGAGPDWIGIFGQCVARVERLTSRLGQVGADAAGFADKVNGLQDYVRAISRVP
ncbi:hypothetical protein [Bordetella flabilis]|uniref:hypothetical protein n=1 Tax=Bordetella flabilis TaxID=463014 RepID=UPI0012F52952|nr:hypothetical protein [Bordetella flabilis]